MENEITSTETRHKGHVKFFNSIKGYGFILPDLEQGEEVFVHHTAIQNNGGFKSLAEVRDHKGEQVEYDLVQGPKGMQASNVTGPNGLSVQGDPSTYRQPYSSDYNRRPYYGGYIVDPYLPRYIYTIQRYPFINTPPIYEGMPMPYHPSYGYVPSQNSASTIDPLSARLMHYPQMTMYSNYTSPPPPPPPPPQQQQQQQTLTTPPNNHESPLS
ncbi:cold-shock' DNA-binding domain-containing protein [Thamnidium elegans]|nr:cold-shock' DNA-binding domain-containing protein [Thamnidium elegans]